MSRRRCSTIQIIPSEPKQEGVQYSSDHTQWTLHGEGVVRFRSYPVSLNRRECSTHQTIPNERYTERVYIAPRYSTEHTQWALPGEGVVLFWTYPVSAIRRGHRLVLFRTYTVILLKAKSVSALQNIPSERYSERACRSQLSSGQNLSSEAAWYDCVTWPNTRLKRPNRLCPVWIL